MKRRGFLNFLGNTSVALPLLSSPLGFALMNPHRENSSDLNPGSDDPILVVVELSGGNDGLNTVVPFCDDDYYRLRPNLGIRKSKLLQLDDYFGLNPGLKGLQQLWNEGDLAIVHGCGYDQPSFSHFTSMAYWHTGTPNSGNTYGWLGRTADAIADQRSTDLLVQISNQQSLVMNSANHTPVVFDEPTRFRRASSGLNYHKSLQNKDTGLDQNDPYDYLLRVANSATESSTKIQEAWASYKSEVDYGIFPIDLPKVAACIASNYPAQIYHVAFRNNAFDTHVQQPALHQRLLSYASDAIAGFIQDLRSKKLDQKVVVLVYSEFGRRAAENANRGTDHGTANVMFLAGTPIKGGHYGKHPKLKDISINENVDFTVDFRQVYGTVLNEWLKLDQLKVLDSQFEPFNMIVS